jgi:hypothetical protein
MKEGEITLTHTHTHSTLLEDARIHSKNNNVTIVDITISCTDWLELHIGRRELLLSNDRNRVRGAVLGLSPDGASTNLFENFREDSLKRDLSNDTTANPPLCSLVKSLKFADKTMEFLIHHYLTVTQKIDLGRSIALR